MTQTQIPEAQAGYCNLVASFGAKNLPPGGEPVLTSLIEQLKSLRPQPRVVLDVGCNTGWVTTELGKALPNSDVLGCDIDPGMISACERRLEGMSDRPPNVSFTLCDCSRLQDIVANADLIVCAGSTAFFPDRAESLRAIYEVLDEQGVFIDLNYIYSKQPPGNLIDDQRNLYGITIPPMTPAEWIRTYHQTGFLLQTYRVHPTFRLEDGPHSAVYRDLLGSLPGMADFATELVRRRELSNDLAPYRKPAEFWLRKVTPARETTPDRDTLLSLAKTLMLFRSAVPRLPLDEIRRLNPYEFLAYIGDPDSAPGGAVNVKLAAETLRRLGVPGDAAILDIGCFSGLSTLVLGRHFPKVVGIDISEESVGVATTIARKAGASVTFQVADARALGHPPNSVDAVVMTATLGYSPTPELIVREARRVLKPDGLLVEFLYDYRNVSGELEVEVKARVSDDIRLSPLEVQIEAIQEQGFHCILIERSSLIIDGERADRMLDFSYNLEMAENPYLGDNDRVSFRELLHQYAGDLEHAAHEPRAFLCVFRATKGSDHGDREALHG